MEHNQKLPLPSLVIPPTPRISRNKQKNKLQTLEKDKEEKNKEEKSISSDSKFECSELNEGENYNLLSSTPKNLPIIKNNQVLKQQTITSSYNSVYKANIMKLLSEDTDIQEILTNFILRINENNLLSYNQESIKNSIININWNDINIQSNIKTIIINLLSEDIEIKNTILGLIPQSKTQKKTISSKVSDTIIENKPPPPPPIDTNLSFDKRILAFLKYNLNTALSYEEFSNIVIIEEIDLENILQKGFVEGFVDLIINNFKKIELSQRPIHSFARDNSAVYIKISSTKWKRDIPSSIKNNENISEKKWEYLCEMIFDFSQKVDIKIAEIREAGPSDGIAYDVWNNRLNCIRKQASGGIDRIRLISDICQKIAESVFVEI